MVASHSVVFFLPLLLFKFYSANYQQAQYLNLIPTERCRTLTNGLQFEPCVLECDWYTIVKRLHHKYRRCQFALVIMCDTCSLKHFSFLSFFLFSSYFFFFVFSPHFVCLCDFMWKFHLMCMHNFHVQYYFSGKYYVHICFSCNVLEFKRNTLFFAFCSP